MDEDTLHIFTSNPFQSFSQSPSASTTTDHSPHYYASYSPDCSQVMDDVASSPDLVASCDLDNKQQRKPTDIGSKHRKGSPTKTARLLRRHTLSYTEKLEQVPTRKRTYVQFCDPESDTKHSSPRIKIARKFAHLAEVHKPGQRVELLDLPSELLASIIIFAIESPPPSDHSFFSKGVFSHGPIRRWTLDNTPRAPENGNLDFKYIFDPDNSDSRYETSQYKDEAFYPSRMLNSVAITCHRLRKLIRLKEWDAQFWKPAARVYYHLTYYPKVLPDSLDLIQGFLPTNQTSWRNFLTCTVQYIDTRKRGVESFGTKAGCKPAIPWRDHQAALSQNHGRQSQPQSLMMLCRQPGPDLFDISWDAATGSYTIAMGLNGGKSYALVDQKGNFTRGEELRPDLMRSVRGLFPADILEVKNDRFSIVKIGARNFHAETNPSPNTSGHPVHPAPTFKEVIRWDLSCVPEVLQDNKARIARCASWDDYLCFTLFKQNFADPTAPFLDPPEDSMVYCIKATGTDAEDGSSGSTSKTKKFRSSLVWLHNFILNSPDEETEKKLEPAVCHVALSLSYAAILLRWNSTSVVKRIVDDKRQLHIIDLQTGKIVRRFNLPPFEWDFRHSDMGEEYNQIRLDKLRALYDDTHAVHRTTRVHDDKLILLESLPDSTTGLSSAKIITGSHDYCNWVWDLRQDSDDEPLLVLDDFYWETDTNEQQQTPKKTKNKWNKFKERAGWWCSTPNQVLDFWHDFSITPDGRFFAAIRAGRTFIWDLNEQRPTIKGYTSELEEYGATPEHKSDQSVERYLGRPTEACNHRHGHAFLRWFEYKNRLPEQGLWMVFDDWSVVYLNRNDILKACGLIHREWIFSEDHFESINARSTARAENQVDNEEDEDTDTEEYEM
ncbi:hypothetical protein ABW20_dc0104028 [Dactylellina cionopaga]|nr:hypothetical protein ABW20_dc0104028 [Dactylellina cionopaga]